jgi:long-chain acyl-CoA synthetase
MASITARFDVHQQVKETVTPIDALFHQVNCCPDGVAFVMGRDVWSYRRLANEADRLAQALVAIGIRKGDRVALHMGNMPELVTAYCACFRMGAIAAPLNTRFKGDELRSLIERLQPALYLGQSQFYPHVAAIEHDLLPTTARYVIGDIEKGDPAQPWTRLLEHAGGSFGGDVPPDTDAPSLLLTTSGTTGQPKFVTHTPATLSATIDLYADLGLDGKQIPIIALPMVHAAGLRTFLACIRVGAPVVLLERFDAGLVLDAIAKHRCSWMLGLPFMFAQLVSDQRARRREVGSLQTCLSAGDFTSPNLQQTFLDVFDVPLNAFWSSTETGPLAPGQQIGPVSRIADTMEARLIDKRGMQVSCGDVGELLLRGPSITVGYWLGSDGIDDPKHDGWFATGDLARRGNGNDLWFVGRKKDLIIRGGSNISPVEVERVFQAHPSVRDVAIVGVPDDALGQRVAAIIQLASEANPNEIDNILADARKKLADYKVPEKVTIVSEIPRNALGKIERKSLLDML